MAACDGDSTITITFDYSTGIIEKAMSLNVAEMAKADFKAAALDGTPLFYMTKYGLSFNNILEMKWNWQNQVTLSRF